MVSNDTRMSESLELDLTLYPAPVLRQVAEPIERFDGDLERLVEAMFARMIASQGVGLAAPQVGLKRRLLVLSHSGQREDGIVLVNPTIVSRTGAMTIFDEGCLSFPGIYAEIRRPERCAVRAFDAEGRPLEREFEGFESRIVQHEYDHLEGVLLVDRMSPADKLRNKSALEELVARFEAARRRQPARP
jgi:peptide deformylase